jgi:hypothetical protein
MTRKCFFNRNSEVQIGFPELRGFYRIELSEGEISGPICLKMNGYQFTIICVRGTCIFSSDKPEKGYLESQKIEEITFEGDVLSSKELKDDEYYIQNRGDGQVLMLIQKIEA